MLYEPRYLSHRERLFVHPDRRVVPIIDRDIIQRCKSFDCHRMLHFCPLRFQSARGADKNRNVFLR